MASNTSPFSSFVPGFDFLQGLVCNAGSALPGIGQWVTPTLNPEELERRINELRTVQFWLEQNARMLSTTIQALEVQKLTLTTLKTMNVQMDDLRDSLQMKPAAAQPSPFSASSFFATTPETTSVASAPAEVTKAGDTASGAPVPGVDPMQWWNALTQQFTQLATDAMQKGAADVSKHMPSSLQPAAPGEPSPVRPAAATNGAKPAAKATRKPAAKARIKPPARPRSKPSN